jgi:hypothetical protein
MSRLRLIGVSLALLSVLALGGPASAIQPQFCIDVIAYGTNPETGECHQYPNPCSVPQGWIISYTGCAAAA